MMDVLALMSVGKALYLGVSLLKDVAIDYLLLRVLCNTEFLKG